MRLTSVRLIAVVIVLLSFLPLLILSPNAIKEIQAASESKARLDSLSSKPGGFAWDYLQGSVYSTMIVECDAVNDDIVGNKTVAFADFNGMVRNECEKQDYRFVWSYGFDQSLVDTSYSRGVLEVLASQSRDFLTEGQTCVLHILFLNGHYSDESSYMGLALDASTIIIFPEMAMGSSLSIAIAHEFGHLLGLVGTLGLDSPYVPPGAHLHYDHANPWHCDQVDCLMNSEAMMANSPCSYCREDLAYLRGTVSPYADSNSFAHWATIVVSLLLFAVGLMVGIRIWRSPKDSLSWLSKAWGVSSKDTVIVVAVITVAMLVSIPFLLQYGVSSPSFKLDRLNISLPNDYHISSATSFGDRVVLLCHHDYSFFLLTYKWGDSSFQEHEISIYPSQQGQEAFLTINDSLYLFYTMQWSDGLGHPGATSYLQKVDATYGSLGDQIALDIPSRFVPITKISDGKYIYFIGGWELPEDYEQNPAWTYINNITRFDLRTGEFRVITYVFDANIATGFVLGEDLIMIHGSSGYPYTVDWWDCTAIGLNEPHTIRELGSLDLNPTWSTLPTVVGSEAFFFNPWRYNGSSFQYEGSGEVWKMNGYDDSVEKLNLSLPTGLSDGSVFALMSQGAFFLINEHSSSGLGTSFWRCEMKGY